MSYPDDTWKRDEILIGYNDGKIHPSKSTFRSPNILFLSPYPDIVRNIDHKLKRNPICSKYDSDPPAIVESSVLLNLLGFKDLANHVES
jgi:hypothetical protein